MVKYELSTAATGEGTAAGGCATTGFAIGSEGVGGLADVMAENQSIKSAC